MVKFSLFKSKTQTAGEIVEWTWPHFALEYLAEHDVRANKDGELYSPAVYAADNVRRNDANVTGMSAVVIDFDNAVGRGNDSRCSDSPTEPGDHDTNLAGLTYAWHTTYTHTETWPRWRLVIPFSRIATPAEFRAAFQYVIELLGHDENIDLSCGDLSRAYWAPSCPEDQSDFAASGYTSGEPLDIDNTIEKPVNVVPLPAPNVARETVAMIPTTPYAGRNDALKAQVAAMLAKNKSLDEMVRELVTYDQQTHNPPLFSDQREGMRLDPWSNALKFIANNIASINARRLADGLPSQGMSAERPAASWALCWYADIVPTTDTHDFVEDVLTDGGLSVIYGDSNTGKTFFVLDLALHVAAGRTWRNKQVQQGGVVYIAAEGGRGIFNRVEAWRRHHQEFSNLPFAVLPATVELTSETDPQRLIALLSGLALPFAIRLIVIDTLSRAMAGGNENSSEDMGAIVLYADMIRAQTGAHVAFIHHSGKDAARGARGHSLLRAATDTEIEIAIQNESYAAVRVTKQRELELVPLEPFSLVTVTLGTNSRGKALTSCVLGSPVVIDLSGQGSRTGRALDCLRDLYGEFRTRLADSGRNPDEARIILQDWRDRLVEEGVLRKDKSMRQRFYDLRAELVTLGAIYVEAPFVYLSVKNHTK